MSTADKLTMGFLALSLALAYWGWTWTQGMGGKLKRWNRWVQRATFAALIGLAAFAVLSVAAWKLGVSLDLAAAGLEWAGPALLAWAALTYGMLYVATPRTERAHSEKPS